jgi:hypothetical protein
LVGTSRLKRVQPRRRHSKYERWTIDSRQTRKPAERNAKRCSIRDYELFEYRVVQIRSALVGDLMNVG